MTRNGIVLRLGEVASRMPGPLQRGLGLGCLVIGFLCLATFDFYALPRIFPFATIALNRSLPTPVQNPEPMPHTLPRVRELPPHATAVPSTSVDPTIKAASPTNTRPAPIPPLYFSKSTTWLSPASRAKLAQLAGLLRADPTLEVTLSGHTDPKGTSRYNNFLSLERAQRAQEWLEAQGIDPHRIHLQGFGSTQPVLDFKPGRGINPNRRVDIAFR